jgi:hypothetical protein
MGGAWNSHGDMKMHTKFQLENLKGQDHLRDKGVDRRIILKLTLMKCEVVDWFKVAQLRV